MLTRLILCSTLFISFHSAARTSPAAALDAVQAEECGTWEDCRDRALAAKEAGDFERFHDLAWRAVQKGPRNDANLMALLARAQSLSGRPGDALVMLQRLAAMGVVTDAADSEDFRRVRALPGWAGLEARIAEGAVAPSSASEKETRTGGRSPVTTSPAREGGPPAAEKPAVPVAPPKPGQPTDPKVDPAKPAAPADPEPPARTVAEDAPGAEVDDAVRFTTLPFEPAGLAYDAVSNRFIIGDRRDRKLHVIGERSQRIATLAGEESAGFGQIEAIAIDPREGDLWVASTPDGDVPPKLHKLQLISGRVLFTAALPDDAAEARLTDIAVESDGVVYALDSAGRRLFRLAPGSQDVERVSTPDLPSAVSIAPAGGAIYIAEPGGVQWLAPGGEGLAPIKAPGTLDLTGLACIRWHRGSLVAVQRAAGGLFRIVRIRLDRAGRRATGIDLLEKDVAMVSPSSIAVRGNALFYLGSSSGYSATGGMDVTIRRVALR